ncbi:phosphoglucomutase [Phenylobacterium sp. Root77]|jgi:phosphomannomutase/phosphoglucomutase|uniref:phosphomannomutase/phosphoglucomutase n=1 Tax=unclassified Phenylobacterium TaxID=2640670 RepID=UPI0006FC90D8|nr:MULTISPECIES: phosphomannomutase/phosphoglucomutase [unclassified Phenylobacterium]KQW73218.1 phosphoglucomutase [Phenylobacterium sp. Root1277]KQW92438.1 phosphoglucomutase [Phenylobacterium sp. Root1290]KRC40667.1 phosphoglucomutase [Phenylobacterium sp. Root77]
MLPVPRADLIPNTFEYEVTPLVKATGFREYDARWLFGPDINLLGIEALGLGLGTYIQELGQTKIVVGHDYRSYSLSIKQALTVGLVAAGCEVVDIGLALSPVAYYAQFALDAPCVAMVTASHNENGWTGVKMGAQRPLTFGPVEMGRLKEIVLGGESKTKAGGSLTHVQGFAETYIADVSSRAAIKRPLKVVCACGNGTAGAFAPEALRRMGVEVVEMDCDLDWNFPRYNPNPEDHEMLMEMAKAVREHGADLALGFDGDGDRCGVVDDTGEEIFADKIGLMLARDLSALHKNATFVVDVKSTGLFATDPVLAANGAKTVYWKTGHSYIKRKTAELGALAGFEKSGHFFFNAPLGNGYDCGLTAAAAILAMLDRNPGKKLSELKAALPVAWTSLTMSPHCADEEKYGVVDDVVAEYEALAASGGTILGRKIVEVITVNGVRVALEDGSWVLVRASSNKPEIVVVVESTQSEDDMRALFRQEVKPRLAKRPQIGAYNQEV